MLKFFKRRRPVVQVRQMTCEEIQELRILRWHGLTQEQWDALPVLAKVDRREEFFAAQGLAS